MDPTTRVQLQSAMMRTPDRVYVGHVTDACHATTPEQARGRYSTGYDVILVRRQKGTGDCWTLGCEWRAFSLAHALWADEWIGMILVHQHGNLGEYPRTTGMAFPGELEPLLKH